MAEVTTCKGRWPLEVKVGGRGWIKRRGRMFRTRAMQEDMYAKNRLTYPARPAIPLAEVLMILWATPFAGTLDHCSSV